MISPVSALVVAGSLSISFFTAVTPMPYSMPGFRPVQTDKLSDKLSKVTYLF